MMGIANVLERLAAEAGTARDVPDALGRINRELAALRLGIELYLDGQPVAAEGSVLGFGRLEHGRWGLAIRPPGQKSVARPLLEAPYPVQVGALKRLPELLRRLQERV